MDVFFWGGWFGGGGEFLVFANFWGDFLVHFFFAVFTKIDLLGMIFCLLLELLKQI